MARPSIPPQVLAARGVPISLVDGTEVRVCFTFHSLLVLEEKHGGLSGAMDALADPDAAQFGTILGIMAAGLEHVEVPQEDLLSPTGQVVVSLSDTENLSYLLDVQRVAEYAEAMGQAFRHAFPAKEADPTDPPVAPAETTGSPGQSGSTAAPSTSAGPTPSSGA